MIDQELIADFAASFFGYGNLDAPLWFIGMEEGGGATEDNVKSRLAAWNNFGRPIVTDAAAMHFAIGESRLFQPGAPTQATWRGLIKLTLAAKNLPASTEDIREYQISRFARSNGDMASLELLPLPSPSLRAWNYPQWSSLPVLATREKYKEHYLPLRIQTLKGLIESKKPRIVIFYGATYHSHWEAISEVKLAGESFPKTGCKGATRFLLMPHPSARIRQGDKGGASEIYRATGAALGVEFDKQF